ncbi:pyridoxal phosphate-dependent transferase, partial [Rhodocollybia butyracea]
MLRGEPAEHTKTCPAFGHDILKYFCLDPTYTNLNAGSFGCLPHAVRLAYNDLSLELESMPDLFIRRKMKQRVTETRNLLAGLAGAAVDSCVLIPNVAHGVTTILRNFPWCDGDKLIIASTTFHTISRTVDCLSYVSPHPEVSKFELLFPTSHQKILESFRSFVKVYKAPNSSPNIQTPGNFKTLVIFDSIVGAPGVLMPWKEMVRVCKDEGVWSLVDAAHSLGQELSINLDEVDPDFWVANCNKWLYSKRGCALLYVPMRNQALIKHSFPPGLGSASLSNTGVSSFVGEFHWNGSTDIITALTVKPGIRISCFHGGEARIVEYCHTLAITGGYCLANILQTEVMLSPG